MLDLRRLKIFREVARLRSFSAAALALDYSQPAVSHHISRLELEVGAQLLERSHRGGVTLTEAGEVLLEHAETLLARMEDAEAELAEVTFASSSRVRLGAFATASATIVADALVRVRHLRPDLTITLVEGEYPETIERLKSRHIDIAVVFDDPLHPVPPDEQVEIRYLYEDPLLLALPRRHRLAQQDTVDIADLEADAWIEGAGRETPCSLILFAACQEAGYEPRIGFSSGNYQVVQRLVAAGVGVALVPELALWGPYPDVVIRPLTPRNPYRRIGVAVLRGGYRRPPVEAMLAEIEKVCEGSSDRGRRAGQPPAPAPETPSGSVMAAVII
jgi:DNA-binding transcriptional LysR family regulator